MPRNQYQAYAAATHTVGQTKQIVMLYDGAIRLLQQAKEAMREKRIEDRYHLLIRASEIVSGLQACLNFEKGGDIARILYGFYASVDNRIFSLHRTNSIDVCDDVISDLKEMREAWQEIDEGKAGAVRPTPSAPPAEGVPAGQALLA